MKIQSPSEKHFTQVPKAEIQRSSFDRTHGHKTTFNAGDLVPFYVDEALPGDTFNLQATVFARFPITQAAMMDNLYLDTFYFAVPLRLVWDNFQAFMGEQEPAAEPTVFLIPQVSSPAVTGFVTGSLGDYFGLPIDVADLAVNALFFRAYNLIYNEWFRDQNLINSKVVDKDNGPDAIADYVMLTRGKRHDYFTSCLPWPQKGPAVPISTEMLPVEGFGKGDQTFLVTPQLVYETGGTGTVSYVKPQNIDFGASVNKRFYVEEDPLNTGFMNIRADMSVTSINDLRQAFQLQKLYERDARGGTRYTEIIKAHFGVTSPDSRLQRTEFLGGKSTPILIRGVEQTAANTGFSLGYPGGVNTASIMNDGFTKSFTEHCVIIGIVNMRADLTYQQGLPRMFSRRTKYDLYWPALAHLGEQAVLSKEIFVDGTAADDNVFGYQERFAEYRYFPSKVTGEFRSTPTAPTNSLDYWHMAQEFGARPTLSEAFIEENPPVGRVIFAGEVNWGAAILFDSYLKLRCVRPMPVFSVPGMVDHF